MKRVVIKPEFMRARRRITHKPKRVLSDWMAVRVKAGRERYAKRNIERQGHKVFAPFVQDEGTNRILPLFPGYIFVQGAQWHYLRSTYGVLYPIMMGPSAAYMPLQQMKDLLGMADDEGTITIAREKFKRGQKIKVRKGPFKDFVGVYIQGTRERVRLMLQLLGATHELEFDRSAVTGAGHAS